MRAFVAVALLAAVPSLALGQSAPLGAHDPAGLAAAMNAYGHKARLESAPETGNPVISARANGLNYYVDFYGCENGANCTDFQFSLSLAMETPLTPDFANTWNGEWFMGRVFVNAEGDPTLTMTVVGTGGITEANFADTMELWTFAMDQLVVESGW